MSIGLVIVDIVTGRQANLHDELVRLLEQPEIFRITPDTPLYSVAYRPVRRDPGGDQVELWPIPLAIGQTLPIMPLALRGAMTVPLDLEATYVEARTKEPDVISRVRSPCRHAIACATSSRREAENLRIAETVARLPGPIRGSLGGNRKNRLRTRSRTTSWSPTRRMARSQA